jgi:proteasome accessory factor C
VENTEMVETIERAIAKSTLLRIDYASGTKDKTSVREILPIEIYVANGSTYLNAWCQSSKGDRTFRLDRILSYEIIEGSVSNQTRGTNVEAFDSSPIELLVSKSARNFIEDNRAIIGHVEEGERLLVELNPIDREWLVRTILGFGGQIEVSKPKELALEVVSRAREIKESYRS